MNLGPLLSRPLRQGRLKLLFRLGVFGAGVVAPLLLQLWERLGGRHSRLVAALASVCTLVGGYCLRHVTIYAGHASAHDPEATYAYADMGESPARQASPRPPTRPAPHRVAGPPQERAVGE